VHKQEETKHFADLVKIGDDDRKYLITLLVREREKYNDVKTQLDRAMVEIKYLKSENVFLLEELNEFYTD